LLYVAFFVLFLVFLEML